MDHRRRGTRDHERHAAVTFLNGGGSKEVEADEVVLVTARRSHGSALPRPHEPRSRLSRSRGRGGRLPSGRLRRSTNPRRRVSSTGTASAAKLDSPSGPRPLPYRRERARVAARSPRRRRRHVRDRIRPGSGACWGGGVHDCEGRRREACWVPPRPEAIPAMASEFPPRACSCRPSYR